MTKNWSSKAKGTLILIFVIPILLVAFGMYLDTWCAMTIKDDGWRENRDNICEISYNFINQINSRVNPQN
ncbi:exported hypothetical protein [metagenome]